MKEPFMMLHNTALYLKRELKTVGGSSEQNQLLQLPCCYIEC